MGRAGEDVGGVTYGLMLTICANALLYAALFGYIIRLSKVAYIQAQQIQKYREIVALYETRHKEGNHE